MLRNTLPLIALVLVSQLGRPSLAVIDFERTPTGQIPRDNAPLDSEYMLDANTSIRFYFDINDNRTFDPGVDVSPIYEERGPDRVHGFKGHNGGEDTPYCTFAGPCFNQQLGDFFLRQPPENAFGNVPSPFIVEFNTPHRIRELSGEIWDIDGGGRPDRTEQWLVEAWDEDGIMVSDLSSPIGYYQSSDADLNGRPWEFRLTALPAGVNKLRITFIGEKKSDIGLAFNNFSPFSADPASFIQLDPRSTYLHAFPSGQVTDAPQPPGVISLQDDLYFPVEPGDLLKITRFGEFDYNIHDDVDDTIDGISAIFAASDQFLGHDQFDRVSSPVAVVDGFFTEVGGSSHVEDIPHDFHVDPIDSPLGGTVVRVPDGATHLFLAAIDSFWKDNAVLAGQFGVTIANLGNGASPGDINQDGHVNLADFNVWDAHKFTASSDWTDGDLNRDGVVDGADFNIWFANHEIVQRARAVPEPTCGVLALMALLVAHPVRRSSRRTSLG